MLSTCPTAPDGGYDREVRDAWVDFFLLLPDGASVLDVGTGNGVVALIAAETALAQGKNWAIHGTDLAQIDPLRYVPDGARRLAGIAFHPGVATEHLPFETESFDAVSGHYALEYTDLPIALAQVHRVLKRGGNAQFILHNSASLLVQGARTSLRQADIVLEETKVFRCLHRLVTMESATLGTMDSTIADMRAAIQRLNNALHEARQGGDDLILRVTLDAVQKLLAAKNEMKPHEAGREVDHVEGELRASARRLNDLLEHACTEQDMEDIQRNAAAVGFSQIERIPQYHNGKNLVGWRLQIHRA